MAAAGVVVAPEEPVALAPVPVEVVPVEVVGVLVVVAAAAAHRLAALAVQVVPAEADLRAPVDRQAPAVPRGLVVLRARARLADQPELAAARAQVARAEAAPERAARA